MSAPSSDYFANHRRARKFPWSLYHRPLEQDLAAFLNALPRKPELDVLVIGCGLFHELDLFPPEVRLTVVDIDGRAIEAVRTLNDPHITRLVEVNADTDLATLGRFDAAYAKEVIEHVIDADAWLRGLRGALRPDGRVWLSTPNYGEPWLPALELTALELVARASGYTRHGIHPTKFSQDKLASALRRTGYRDVSVHPAALRLALVASATV